MRGHPAGRGVRIQREQVERAVGVRRQSAEQLVDLRKGGCLEQCPGQVPGGLIQLATVEGGASEGEVVGDLGVGFHE